MINIQVGKFGISDNVINEIKEQLKKHKIVKVSFLKSFLKENDRKEAAKELAEKTGASIDKQIGGVVMLKLQNKKRRSGYAKTAEQEIMREIIRTKFRTK